MAYISCSWHLSISNNTGVFFRRHWFSVSQDTKMTSTAWWWEPKLSKFTKIHHLFLMIILSMLSSRASCTWKDFAAWKKAKWLSLRSRSHWRDWNHSELLAREVSTVWAVKGDLKARRSRNDAQRETGQLKTVSLINQIQMHQIHFKYVNRHHCFRKSMMPIVTNHLALGWSAELSVLVILVSTLGIQLLLSSCSPFSVPFPQSLPPRVTLSRVGAGKSIVWPGLLTF